MTRRHFSLLLFLFTCLLLYACGGGPRGKEWTVAIDPSWYPMNFMGRDKQILGFTTELLQEVAHLQKIKVAKVQENWDNLLSNLQKEKYDAILSSMQPYIFYEKQYDFSHPFLLTGPVLVLPEDSKVTSFEQLSGKEVAVISGTADALLIEKFPGIIIRTFDSIPDAFNAMVMGHIDGAVVDGLQASAYCDDLYHGQLKVVGAPLTDQGLRMIALHDKALPLIEAFNATIDKLKKSGKFAELSSKWGLPIVHDEYIMH